MANRYGGSLSRKYKDGKVDEPILNIAQVIPVPEPAPVKPVEPAKKDEVKK